VVAEVTPPAGTSRWRNGGDVQVMVSSNGETTSVGRAKLDPATRSALVTTSMLKGILGSQSSEIATVAAP